MSKVTQQDRVVQYIDEFGSITNLEAVRELGVGDLAGVVRDLRRKGTLIKTTMMDGVNRYGDKTTYGVYSFVNKEDK